MTSRNNKQSIGEADLITAGLAAHILGFKQTTPIMNYVKKGYLTARLLLKTTGSTSIQRIFSTSRSLCPSLLPPINSRGTEDRKKNADGRKFTPNELLPPENLFSVLPPKLSGGISSTLLVKGHTDLPQALQPWATSIPRLIREGVKTKRAILSPSSGERSSIKVSPM